MPDISNRDDVIDSREVEEQIDDLDSEQEGYIEDFESADEALIDAANEFLDADAIAQHNGIDPSGELTKALEEAATALVGYWDMEKDANEGETVIDHAKRLLEAFRNPEDQFLGNDELHALKAFRDEFEDYCPDWRHGTTIIRDSYFKEYAQDLAEEIGAIKSDASWPNDCIDWDKAARELRMDYTSGFFDGVCYWAR